jgi:hypothetical protein
MENAPVVVITAINLPSDSGERYDKWWDAAYGPISIKSVGQKGIDRYRRVKTSLELPGTLTVYHHDNLNGLKERAANPDRQAITKDQQTWPIDWYWLSVYRLVRSFRNPGFSTGNREDTIVENAPVIYIEGYKLPPNSYEKYTDWFARWASRLYIPMLLKDTNVKCFNCFRLVDYKMPLWENVHLLEPDLPPFVSIAYFENLKDFEEYKGSLEYAIFKRSLDVEFSGNLKTVWSTEYQLLKSYRPQP